MDSETIKRLDSLRLKLDEVEQKLRWIDEGEKELYREDYDKRFPDEFHITISRRSKAVIQFEISREDAEARFKAEKANVESLRDEIKREIEAL